MNRVIFHVDANSAYLSWTAAFRLAQGSEIDLREIPSCIGGSEESRHGIVLAKSIPAKKFGIGTGYTLRDARSLCPGLVVVPPDYNLYMNASNAMVEIFREYSPKVQRFSIDECFIDYTNMEYHFGPPMEAAYTIKNRIKAELGFTVNVGVSVNKILAKMGSELKKPDRVHSLWPEEIETKLWPLPVGELFMIGSRTNTKLLKLGINTIGDLARADTDMLLWHLKSHGQMIQNYANGIDYSPVKKSNFEFMKSIGNSTTSRFDVDNEREALMILFSLLETTATRLRRAGFLTSLVTISVVSTKFVSYTHQSKLPYSTDSTDELYQEIKRLFIESWQKEPIRKLGVRLGALSSNEFTQLSVYSDIELSEKRKRLDMSVDSIRQRYGSYSIYRSNYLHSGISPISGGVGDGDYPLMTSIL